MAIDIIARGLATSLIGSDGRISSDKLPVMGAVPEGATFYPVGAVTDPKQLEGKTFEEILLMMLYGVVSPTLTNPSLAVEVTSGLTAIAGKPVTINGTLVFDRGAISPAYGTSGYRAGAPLSYVINDIEVPSATFTIDLTPVAGENIINCTVYYAEGEQPLNSIGQPFDLPLSAGYLTTSFTIVGTHQIYTADGEELDFTWFEENDGSGYETKLLTETENEKQSFAVNADLKVIGIKQFETMTQTWQWIGGSPEASLATFDTSLIEGDSLHQLNNYVSYIHNGSKTGDRELRIYVE